MNMIFLGAPGAGKGTHAGIVAKKLSIPTISTGNILRAAVKNETPVGLQAKAFMDAGALVPDEVIIGIIKERLQEDDCQNGYILDGVPRTIAQAEALEEAGVVIDVALSIEISDEEIIERMAGRLTCESCSATYHVVNNPPKAEGSCDHCSGKLSVRKDDDPETVKNRLVIYHEQTKPLIDFYKARGKFKGIQSQAVLEQTSAVIFEALGISK